MGYAAVFRAFGLSLIFLGVSMIAPMFVALFTSPDTADDYLFASIVTVLCGGGVLACSASRRTGSDFRAAVVFILLLWIVSPAFAALPFVFENASLIDAYFEAVSALTTTGAWLSKEAAIANPAGALWRAELQWIGGLASLSIAAAIFIRPAFIGIDTLLPPFSRGDRASYLRAVRNAVGAFVGVYLIITLSSFILQMLVGAPVLDALIISMSAVASGGFVPHENDLSAYPFAVTGALLPFLVLSGANFILIARNFSGGAGRSRDVETGVYLISIIIVGFIFWIALGAGDWDLIPAQIFNAASLFSTNGVLVGQDPTLPLALVTVIIGGSAVSTAGGFKILRWMVIMRRSSDELRRLVTPSGVFGKSTVVNEFGVWIHFLAFTIVLAGLTLLLTLNGHGFELSATAATAILANAGPVISLVESGNSGYEIFNAPTRLLLCLGMILGRLETVVALAVFNHSFWRS